MSIGQDWPRPVTLGWRDLAACTGMDPDLFHPDKGHSRTAARAKAVCAGCPVRTDCLAYAEANDIYDGIWGGMSPRDRGALRPQMNKPRPRNQPQPINHGTEGGYSTHRRRNEDACPACLDAARHARRRRDAS